VEYISIAAAQLNVACGREPIFMFQGIGNTERWAL